MLNASDIKTAFKEKRVQIKTCSLNGDIQYNNVLEVLQHFTIIKDIYEIVLVNELKLTATEDHNLFTLKNNELIPIKPKDNPTEIVVLQEANIELIKVKKISKVNKRIFMYDLSVENNHNFFLTNNILVCNSFAPPSSEATIAGFTRTRGYRWPDEQLYMHLVQACNYINLIPPDTGFSLESFPAAWQPLLLLQAMAYALWDLAILWINEEFSYSLNGISLDIQRSDKYQSAASSMQDTVNTQLEAAKRRIHLILGLRQSKYTMGYGAALGPWNSSKMSVKKWVLGFRTSSSKGFN